MVGQYKHNSQNTLIHMSFANLKANRSASMGKLLAAADKLNTNKYEADDRFWSPTVDKAGNGYAVIRFLPACEGEDVAWVRYWDHGFKGSTGRWYIENSLTSIGAPDPVSELNSKLWNASSDDNSAERKQARSQKRRLHYVSNILVVSDPGNPSNEGKLFLFKFGKKIWDKIDDLMHPQFPGDQAVNPFDFWGGANFKLKIRQVEGYRNYDKSEFESPAPLHGGDDKQLEAMYKQLQPLKDLIDPKNYKTYNELKKKLVDVLGSELDGPATAEDVQQEQYTPPTRRSTPAPEPSPTAYTEEKIVDGLSGTTEEYDDSDKGMSYFARLASS